MPRYYRRRPRAGSHLTFDGLVHAGDLGMRTQEKKEKFDDENSLFNPDEIKKLDQELSELEKLNQKTSHERENP